MENEHTSLSRFWSPSSAGTLVCGEGLEKHRLLSSQARLKEFAYHRDKNQTYRPTTLVSASSKLTRTLSGAIKRYRQGEDPKAIWIAFICPPEHLPGEPTLCHSAEELAKQLDAGLGVSPKLYKSEWVFDWEIEEVWVAHKASFQTLMNRGIGKFIDLEHHWTTGSL